MQIRYLLYIVLSLILSDRLPAQEVPKIIRFNSSHYEAGHQNWMVTQDCEGYIYIANTEALLIYNGFKWQKVSFPRNQIPRAVYKGKDCRIYTGAYESFGYIDISKRNKPRYVSLSDSLLFKTGQEIWNIFGNEHQIVFQSFSNIYSYDYQKITQQLPPSNIMLGRAVNGKLYIPKIEQGLYGIEKDTIKEIEAINALPPKTKIADFCAYGDQGVVIGTQHQGLYFLENEKLRPLTGDLNDLLKIEQMNKIIRMGSGTYVIGTILNGIYITDDFKTIKYHINKTNGLSNNTVLSLFEDHNQDLWVGLDKGIDLIKLSSPLTYYYDRQGKLGTIFTSVHHKGQLFLGTNQGLFRSGEKDKYKLVKNSQGQIWSLLTADGDLLCGHNRGTFLVTKDSFIQVSDITGGWCMETVSEDHILQSTYTGLILLKKNKGRWQVKKRLSSGNILIQKFALTGTTLIGYHTHYGLCVLRLSSNFDSVEHMKILDKIGTQPIPQDLDIFTIGDQVFVALNDQLLVFEDNIFKNVDPEEIKANLKIPGFADRFAFHQALAEISKQEDIFELRYSRPAQVNQPIIAGVGEGYLKLDPTISKNFEQNQKLLLDFVTVDGQLQTTASHYDCSPNQKEIAIQLKDFTFTKSKQPLKYKLENWNDHWVNLPEDGFLNFIKLNDGEYRFLVQDSNSKTTLLVSFSIKPHWYESWPGAILLTLLAFSLILFLNQRNIKKLKLQEATLQKEKEKELESQRMLAKNEQLQRDLLFKSKMLANSTLVLVQKNKMLNDLKTVVRQSELKSTNYRQYKQRILNLIDRNITSDEDWEIFEKNFAEVHEDFLEKLKTKFPGITAGELKLAAYIRMNLSSKEIAPLLNISIRSVENKRYRLRKKMGIKHEENLSDYLLRL